MDHDGFVLSRLYWAGAERLVQERDHLNQINTFPVPDGDSGTNMAYTMTAAAEAAATARLQDSGLNFLGYMEPVDIPAGGVDVLVTEGFVGNLMIKWMEGLATLIGSLTDQLPVAAADQMRSYLGPMQDTTQSPDPLLLLGVRGVAVPGHGRSGAKDISRLICHAAQAVRGNLVDHISESLGQLSAREA